MHPEPGYVIAMILVMWMVTFALRAAPFVFLARIKNSPIVKEIGRIMPAGVMVILVVYTLRHVELSQVLSIYGPLAPAVGLLTTVAVHLRYSNALLSMIAGTLAYAAVIAFL